MRTGSPLFLAGSEIVRLPHVVGYFVGTSGSARPVAKVNFDNGKFSFTIPRNGKAASRIL